MAVGTQKGLHTSSYHGNEGSEGDHFAPTGLRMSISPACRAWPVCSSVTGLHLGDSAP